MKLEDQTVSMGWVLNQLAGMQFPEPGQAYDFIKESFSAGQPQFKHYCDQCKFLGPYKWADREYDLYYCEHEVKAVYARFGDGSVDYLSSPLGNIQDSQPLWQARKQARKQKLIP